MIDSPSNMNQGFRSNQFNTTKSNQGQGAINMLRQFSSALDHAGGGKHVTSTASASNLDYIGPESVNNSNLVTNLPSFLPPNNNRTYMHGGFSSQQSSPTNF